MTVTVCPDRQALCAAAASRIERLLAAALEARGQAAVCLTGGATAREVYHLIAAHERPAPRLAWTHVHIFWGDERDVPPDHPESNSGMATAALLAHVPVNATFVHPIPADGRDAGAAARAYDATLRRTAFASPAGHAFDLTLLSLGADAHIASLFPGAPALDRPSAERVVVVPAAANRGRRITLTPATLLDAKRILVMASGADRAVAVRTVLSEPEDVVRWPAQLLRRAGDRVEWLMDSAADGRARAAQPAK